MFTSPRDSYVLLALVALLPGAISWWSGRRLARRADDPALPELLAAHGRRNRAMLVVAIVGLGYVSSFMLSAFATIPLVLGGLVAFAGLIAAAYPLRRVLYHETWSFGSYFWFYPRVMAGLFGFWIVLVWTPSLVALAGTWDWVAGAGLAGVLMLWHTRSGDAVRSCLRAQPIADGEFLSRCRALADACGVPQPRFERIDLGGGVIANAFALPSLRTSSVLFTDTVLDRFDQQELLAICAHELAHFEHYNPVYLRRWSFITYCLIALGAACTPVARITSLYSGPLPYLLWFSAIVVFTAARARGRQRQETICDLRAVELTGDADALVRGLTKLYTVARVPRRIGQQVERSANHPSLARRIRDIRKAAGVAPATLGGAQSFTSADGRGVVTFDDLELRWTERDGETHRISYAHLTELRVDAKARRGSRLVALGGAAAKRWEMSLADADVARLQGVLDVVDGRLADPPRPPVVHPSIQRVVVLTAAVMALTLSQVAVTFVALLALLKPSAPLLVGAGLAAFTAATLAIRDHAGTSHLIVISLPLAVTGAVLLAFAWGHRHDAPQGVRPFIALLALPAAVTAAALAMNGVDVIRLHQSARAMPSATVLFAALAGALACSNVLRVRIAAVVVGIAALATSVAASTAFLDRFATDPFLVKSPALTWVSVGSDAIQEFDVPSNTTRIVLSPNGEYVATFQAADADVDHPSTFQIGRIGQPLVPITADDLAFVNDSQLLVVQSDSRGTAIRTVRLGPSREVVWQQFVEGLSAPSLSFDRATARWRVVGWSGESIVRVEGILGILDVQKKKWPAMHTSGSYISALTAAGPDVLLVEKQYDRGLLAQVIPWQWTWALLLEPYNQVSRYATIDDRGRRTFGASKLGVDCLADVLLDGGLACAVYDGTRTHIVKIDAGTGHVEGIGVLDDHFVGDQNVVRGWLTGWAGARPIAIRLSTGEALRLPEGSVRTSQLSIANDRLAALMFGPAHDTVRLYALPPDTRSADGVVLGR